MQQIYIVIAIGALAVIAVLMIFTKKIRPESKLSPLAGLSFAFVIAGAIFGESRLAGYGLMGIGILIAVVDVVRKLKKVALVYNLVPTDSDEIHHFEKRKLFA